MHRALTLFVSVSLCGSTGVVAEVEPSGPPWRHVVGWLTDRRDAMASDLSTSHTILLARAETDGLPELVELLAPEAPRPRPTGYGLLPEIIENPTPKTVEPQEQRYSIEKLTTRFAPSFRDASVLSRRVTADPDLPLEPWVEEFVRLRERMRNLEDHLDYHRSWQMSVVDSELFFAKQNQVVRLVRRLQLLREAAGDQEAIDELQRDLLERISPFDPTPGLRLEHREDGKRVLPVTLHTDIDDAEFLSTFLDAVEAAFVESETARSMGFAVELRWETVSPDRLYPDGPPARGDAINVEDHRERFPERALVLTTGAESTHAWTGRSVLLGTAPVTPRTLAHEFAHILGFGDAYVRGFDGDPASAYGAVLVEWGGLKDDLMGNPEGGRVTREMIDRLLDAYDGP